MSDVDCARCRRTAPGLERPPLPGPPGEAVQRHTCATCWKDWLRAQVMLINEYRLSPRNPEHYERLVDEMRGFLNLDDERG